MAREPRLTFIEETDDGEEVEHVIPSKYEVCPNCSGKGSHVNPNVDGHGISAEEFAEDEDFEEAYHRGDYDVRCEECDGQRVQLMPDWDATWAPGLKEKYEEKLEDDASYARERAIERRMGY
jgi:hypothetical protein